MTATAGELDDQAAWDEIESHVGCARWPVPFVDQDLDNWPPPQAER